MGLRRTTLPAAEPLTLAEAKLHLRVDDASEDTLIAGLINVARGACEERTQTTMINSGWTLTLNSFDDLEYLSRPPVVSIISISYVNPSGTTVIMSSGDYMLEATNDKPMVMPVTDWPETKDQLNAVTVVYTAGYGASGANVPAPLKQWMLLAIGDMYANREASSDRPAVPQDFAVRLLDPWIAYP